MARPFPDLKGQAPLRLRIRRPHDRSRHSLFLTSKVRLHCDHVEDQMRFGAVVPFPDLKGQAPLRPAQDQATPRRPDPFS